MTDTHWQRLTHIVDEALRRPDPRERARYLRRACRGERRLRREVEQLLRYENADAEILAGPLRPRAAHPDPHTVSPETVSPETARPPLSVLEPGRPFGRYRVERLLGHGGTSAVAQAFDPELGRHVALKVIRAERRSRELLERFHAERRILARLAHPSIARIFDGGTVDGLPYFTMELVEGEPIDAWCDRRRLPVGERLALVLAVCAALETAHRHLVVHRDLKPDHILITAEGTPKLLDFGIAKVLDTAASTAPDEAADAAAGDAPDVSPSATRPGRQPLTLAWASPEQIRGHAVTTATDVYALGVVLYELLSGHPPYLLDGDAFENARTICEVEPEPPSRRTVVARETWRAGAPVATPPDVLAARRGSDPRALRRQLRGDLDSVVQKALAKDPDARYRSIEQLADDLRRHLDGRPLGSRPGVWPYRAGKLIVRHGRRLAAAAVVLLGLVTAVAVKVRGDREIARVEAEQERATRDAELQAEALERFVRTLLRAADPNSLDSRTFTAVDILDFAERRARADLAGQPELLARQLEAIGLAHFRLGRPAAARPLIAETLRRRNRLYGDHPLVARGLNNLGAVHFAAGAYEEAEVVYRLSLAMKHRLGDDDAKTLANLAGALMQQGKLDEAEPLYRAALERRQKRWGRESHDVATNLRSLGILLHRRGELAAAEPLLREALAIRRRIYSPDHTAVAAALVSLGRLLQARGELAAARSAFTEALEIRQARLGATHPHVALLRHDLASLDRSPPSQADYH